MSHPLLRVVCLYAAGVLLGSWGEFRWFWLLAVLLGLSVAGAFFKRCRPLLCSGLLLFGGWLNFTCQTQIWSDLDLRRQLTGEPVLADVRGRLVETPRITRRLRNGATFSRTQAELEITMLRTNRGAWMPSTGRIAVSSPGTLGAPFHQGQCVQISGVLAKPEGPLAEGLFDYGAYLNRRGIHFQLRADGTNDWALGKDGEVAPPLTDRFLRWARQTLSTGLPEDDPATGLLQAMTLGWKTALTDEVERPFMESGTMHIFAVSGLHIALIAGILLSVLRLLRVPGSVCGVLVVPALWFYTAATGWQASAVRASLMMTVILGGWSLRRPSNLLNSLAAAALLILAVEPRQLFQASFQLSFAVVLSLSLLLPPLRQRLLQALQPDPLLPSRLVPRWKRRLGTPLRWLLLTIATSLAAWVGAMPLTAHYFHLFSPGTLLANLMLLPCAGAALASALASLVTGAWWPWLSEVFNHGAWFWMHRMMDISRGVAALPGAFRHVPSPSQALLAVYYGTFLLVALGWFRAARLRWLLMGSGTLLVALFLRQIHIRHSSASMTVLPLDGGMAVHVKAPDADRPMLVDCGNLNAFEAVVADFLHARGEDRIQALVLTHGEVRHMGAASQLLEQFPAPTLGLSTVRFRSGPYRALLNQPLPGRVEVVRLQCGDQFAGWEILHPPSGLTVRLADEGALVLRGQIRGNTILLLSDLNRHGQRMLMEENDPGQLRANIVVTGLPGEGEPLINDLLLRVQPELIIIGDDDRPANRRAPPGLLVRLQESGASVLSTRETGAVQVEFDDRGWKAVDARGRILHVAGGEMIPATRTLSRNGSPDL